MCRLTGNHTRLQRKGLAWFVISPAESLNGISIQEVMVLGDWRNVNGKLGVCKHGERESSYCCGVSLIRSACWDKTRVTAPSPRTHPPAQTPTFSLTTATLMKSLKRGSGVLADQTNTAAAFKPCRQGGSEAQGDWKEHDNRCCYSEVPLPSLLLALLL